MIAVLFGLGLSTSAQEGGKREMPNAEQMTERMKTQLELTDEQYKSVYVANEEMIKMMEEAGGRDADQDTKNKIKKQHMAKLNEILTPEQIAKMKDQKQQRDRKRKHAKTKQVEE